MKTGKATNGFRFATALILCAGLLVMAVCNWPLIAPALQGFFTGETNFTETRQAIADSYASDELWSKYAFVNANGLFMKLCGRRSVNETTRMNDGMLTVGASGFFGGARPSPLAAALPPFSRALEQMGTNFLFVQVPSKIDLKGALLPAGLSNVDDATADRLLASLRADSVDALDLRPLLTSSVDQVEKYFYRTDHHWNQDGAFVAFGAILERLKDYDPAIDLSLADPGLWERHVKEDWFLGSRGKRVGEWYAGTDPLVWYTPKFDTAMSCIITHRREIFKGDYARANIRDLFIDTRDLFGLNAYCVNIGGDYPLVRHLNPNAPNRARVLVFKDSFTLPLQALLSAAFTQVDVIDLRYYTETTAIEYCDWYRPDYAIMAINANSLTTAAHAELGLEDYAPGGEPVPLVTDLDLRIEANDKAFNYAPLPVELEAGKTYRFSFRELSVPEGATDGVSAFVYDYTARGKVLHRIFDAEYSQQVGDAQWTFRMPEDETGQGQFKLLLYAGIVGATEGIGIECDGIELYELP